MTTFNDLLESFGNRVKSPIFGSVSLAFIACNWKPLYYLFFSKDILAESKFIYFDDHTNWLTLFVVPILTGTALAIGLPYINYLAAKAIRKPLQDQRLLEIQSASERLIEKSRLANIRLLADEQFDKHKMDDRRRREEDLIEQAKRDQDALKIENEEIRQKLQEALMLSRETESNTLFNEKMIPEALYPFEIVQAVDNINRDPDRQSKGNKQRVQKVHNYLSELLENLNAGEDRTLNDAKAMRLIRALPDDIRHVTSRKFSHWLDIK